MKQTKGKGFRYHMLAIRISSAEKDELKQRAERLGIDLSQFVRELLRRRHPREM